MGFVTNVSISNDFWYEISKDPQKLVDAIGIGMNYGIDGPLTDAHDAADGGRWAPRYAYVRQATPQGLTVHQAQHADTPQIIVNTYGSHPIAAHEIVSAIEHGWLDTNDYHETHAEEVAKLLHAEAARIRKAVKNKKAGKSVWA
jgi:hypothetical protein